MFSILCRQELSVKVIFDIQWIKNTSQWKADICLLYKKEWCVFLQEEFSFNKAAKSYLHTPNQFTAQTCWIPTQHHRCLAIHSYYPSPPSVFPCFGIGFVKALCLFFWGKGYNNNKKAWANCWFGDLQSFQFSQLWLPFIGSRSSLFKETKLQLSSCYIFQCM